MLGVKVTEKRNIKELTPLQEKQAKYWSERAESLYLSGEKDSLKVAKELKTLYARATREINKEIEAFYGRYATENGLSLEEAKKLLNKTQLKSFKENLQELLALGKKENLQPAQLNEFKKLYVKTRISRLAELEANIRWELYDLASKTENKIGNLLYDTYEDGYYRTIYNEQQFLNTDRAFTGLNKEAIEKAINTKYLSENYSSVIWQNTDRLMKTLTQEIPRGLVLGYNPNKLAREVISKRVDKTAYNNTVRLIRTEYSKILNDATIDGYKQAGIASFKILTALDSRTCDDCDDFEGKIVNINEVIEGVNIPPFHPNCRCTTVPYFEPDEIDDMTEEELDNIGFITYDDWKNGLVKLENGKVKYSSKAKIED